MPNGRSLNAAFICSVLAGLLLPCVSALGQYRHLRVEVNKPTGYQLRDVFVGNTYAVKAHIYENAEPVSLDTNWTYYFRVGYGQYDTQGMVTVEGTVSLNTITFWGGTNVWFREGTYYFSIVGEAPSGETLTFCAGELTQTYEPGAASPPDLNWLQTFNWDLYTYAGTPPWIDDTNYFYAAWEAILATSVWEREQYPDAVYTDAPCASITTGQIASWEQTASNLPSFQQHYSNTTVQSLAGLETGAFLRTEWATSVASRVTAGDTAVWHKAASDGVLATNLAYSNLASIALLQTQMFPRAEWSTTVASRITASDTSAWWQAYGTASDATSQIATLETKVDSNADRTVWNDMDGAITGSLDVAGGISAGSAIFGTSQYAAIEFDPTLFGTGSYHLKLYYTVTDLMVRARYGSEDVTILRDGAGSATISNFYCSAVTAGVIESSTFTNYPTKAEVATQVWTEAQYPQAYLLDGSRPIFRAYFADTNSAGSELLYNDDFASDASGWLLQGAYWDSGEIKVSPGDSATIVYTNEAFPQAGFMGYVTVGFNSSSGTAEVVFGGNRRSLTPSGTVSVALASYVASNLTLNVTATGQTMRIDYIRCYPLQTGSVESVIFAGSKGVFGVAISTQLNARDASVEAVTAETLYVSSSIISTNIGSEQVIDGSLLAQDIATGQITTAHVNPTNFAFVRFPTNDWLPGYLLTSDDTGETVRAFQLETVSEDEVNEWGQTQRFYQGVYITHTNFSNDKATELDLEGKDNVTEVYFRDPYGNPRAALRYDHAHAQRLFRIDIGKDPNNPYVWKDEDHILICATTTGWVHRGIGVEDPTCTLEIMGYEDLTPTHMRLRHSGYDWCRFEIDSSFGKGGMDFTDSYAGSFSIAKTNWVLQIGAGPLTNFSPIVRYYLDKSVRYETNSSVYIPYQAVINTANVAYLIASNISLSFGDLQDVSFSGLSTGQVAKWNGLYWVNQDEQDPLYQSQSNNIVFDGDAAGGDLTGTYPNPSLAEGSVGLSELAATNEPFPGAVYSVDSSTQAYWSVLSGSGGVQTNAENWWTAPQHFQTTLYAEAGAVITGNVSIKSGIYVDAIFHRSYDPYLLLIFTNVVAGIGGSIEGQTNAAILSGLYNTIHSNQHGNSVIAGGAYNRISSYRSFIGGGWSNVLGANHGVIGGGLRNYATGSYCTIAGGVDNVASGSYCTVGGGDNNQALTYDATVAGGSGNIAEQGTVAGGHFNATRGMQGFIGGGSGNLISTGASYAVVPGGLYNTAHGDYSWAGGKNATAMHDRAWVWSTFDDGYSSHGDGTFNVGISTASQFYIKDSPLGNLVYHDLITAALVDFTNSFGSGTKVVGSTDGSNFFWTDPATGGSGVQTNAENWWTATQHFEAGFTVAGSGKVDNLNADLLDGHDSSAFLQSETDPNFAAASNSIVFDGDAAGGDLTGTYPDPTLAAGSVGPAEISATNAPTPGRFLVLDNSTQFWWRVFEDSGIKMVGDNCLLSGEETGSSVTGHYCGVVGGQTNRITDPTAIGAFIIGGRQNIIGPYNSYDALILGGLANQLNGPRVGILGGRANRIVDARQSMIIGGYGNLIGGGDSRELNEAILAGYDNEIQAGSTNACILAGAQNYISNAPFCAVSGYRARALHQGCFVWQSPGGTTDAFESTGTNQFLLNLPGGGVGINTNAPEQELEVNGQVIISGPIETNPPAPAHGPMLYSADEGGTLELWVVDTAGNYTRLSPHDGDRLVIRSMNPYTGKSVWIDLEKLAMAVVALTGDTNIAQVTQGTPWRDWDAEEAAKEQAALQRHQEWEARKAAWQAEYNEWLANPGTNPPPVFTEPEPPLYTPRPNPYKEQVGL